MKTGMICPSCKEAFLVQLTVLDDIEVTGFSLLPGGMGMKGLVRDSHHALYCPAERRDIFNPRRKHAKVGGNDDTGTLHRWGGAGPDCIAVPG